jgi:hypothetical protein
MNNQEFHADFGFPSQWDEDEEEEKDEEEEEDEEQEKQPDENGDFA